MTRNRFAPSGMRQSPKNRSTVSNHTMSIISLTAFRLNPRVSLLPLANRVLPAFSTLTATWSSYEKTFAGAE